MNSMRAGDTLHPLFLVHDIWTKAGHLIHLIHMVAPLESQIEYLIRDGHFLPGGCITGASCLLDHLEVQVQCPVELQAFGGQDDRLLLHI